MTDNVEPEFRRMLSALNKQREEYVNNYLKEHGVTLDELKENYIFEESDMEIGEDGSLRQDYRIRPMTYEEKEGKRGG